MAKEVRTKINFEADVKFIDNLKTVTLPVETKDDKEAVKRILEYLLGYPAYHSDGLSIWNLLAKSSMVDILDEYLKEQTDANRKSYLSAAIQRNYISLARILLDIESDWKPSDFRLDLEVARALRYKEMVKLVMERLKKK